MKFISANGQPNSIEIASQIAKAILDGRIIETSAWEATTNIKGCGGMNPRCRAIIHRALRKIGCYFDLALYEGVRTDTDGEEYTVTHHKWGIASKEELGWMLKDPELIILESGYTLSHAAHKLGEGDATKGWKLFHGH